MSLALDTGVLAVAQGKNIEIFATNPEGTYIEKLKTLSGHDFDIIDLIIFRDGKTLVSVDNYQNLKFWDVRVVSAVWELIPIKIGDSRQNRAFIVSL